jgi:flagellar motor switch protein FliN/FliY
MSDKDTPIISGADAQIEEGAEAASPAAVQKPQSAQARQTGEAEFDVSAAVFPRGELDEPEAASRRTVEQNLAVVMGVPVKMQVVLGAATMPVASLLKLGRGAIVELDHKVGEPVAIMINDRVIARGEVVVVDEDRFGVTLTDIVADPFSGASAKH